MEQETFDAAFKELKERTARVLHPKVCEGGTVSVETVWHNLVHSHYQIQKQQKPQAKETELLLLAEVAIYDAYIGKGKDE